MRGRLLVGVSLGGAVVLIALVVLWLAWFMEPGGTFDAWLQARASLYGGGLGVLGGIIGGVAGGFVGGWLALRASERAVRLQVEEAARERQRQAEEAAKEREEAEARRVHAILRALQVECNAVGLMIDPQEDSGLFRDRYSLPLETITLATLPAALPIMAEMQPPFDQCFYTSLRAQQALVRLNIATAHLRSVSSLVPPNDPIVDEVRQRADEAMHALIGVWSVLGEVLPPLSHQG